MKGPPEDVPQRIRSHFGSSQFWLKPFRLLRGCRYRHRPVKRQKAELKVTVGTVGGSQCEIQPHDHWTCHGLKVAVQERLGVPMPQQRLIHGGKLIEVMTEIATGTIGQLLALKAGQEMSLELLLLVRSVALVKVLEAVKRNGNALGDASEELKGDRELVMEAVKQCAWALEYASEELKGDKEVVMETVKQHARALPFASQELKGDREVVMEAGKTSSDALEYASEDLKGDREFLMEAVKQHGYALRYASQELKGDKEVVMVAVKQCGWALQYASQELKGDREVVMEAVKQDRSARQYASQELRSDHGGNQAHQ